MKFQLSNYIYLFYITVLSFIWIIKKTTYPFIVCVNIFAIVDEV